MKELELKVSLKNNRLKRRRLERGLNQSALADAIGISHGAYRKLECLETQPVDEEGLWRPIAEKLAVFFGEELSELFPDAIFAIAKPTVTMEVDATELPRFLPDSDARRLLEGPEAALEGTELNAKVHQALLRLDPRTRKAVEAHYGLSGEEATLEDVGRQLDVSKARARQIIAKGLRQLRHPSVSVELAKVAK